MTWALAIALLGTSAILGRLLDAGLHRLYTPKMRDWLFQRAIWADELTYVELLHGDTKRVARVLDNLFGSRRFSPRMAVVSLVPVLLLEFSMRGDFNEGFWDDIRWLIASVTAAPGMTMAVTNVIQDQISLKMTRRVLRMVKPSLRSLGFWISVDVVLSVFLAGLPLALYIMVAESQIGRFETAPESLLLRLVWVIASAIFMLLVPLSMPWDPLTRLFFALAAIGGAIPTLIHLAMLLRDLTVKSIIRPACVYLSGLLETLSGHDRPMTTIFTAVGVVPVLVKFWLDVAK